VSAAFGDARRDVVEVIFGLEPDVEVQPVLGRPLEGRLGAQLEEGPSSDGWRRDRGATLTTSVQPVSQDQNSASLSGSAESSGSAATGPAPAYSARSSMTQKGCPRVGEHHPWRVSLTDVEPMCAQPEHPIDLFGLAGPAREVQMQPKWVDRRLGDALEAQVQHGPPSIVSRVSKPAGSSVSRSPPTTASQNRPSRCGSTASKTRFSRYMHPP